MSWRERSAWLAVALLALPVAFALVRLGWGLRVASPLRDLAWLLAMAAAEELVFRGGLQAWLRQRPGGAWCAPLPGSPAGLPFSRANGLTSALFAAAHLPGHPAPAALGVLPVSLLLGLAYERSRGRLALPSALHAGFNVALYLASALGTTPGG